jgi:serine/threonine-protein kinase
MIGQSLSHFEITDKLGEGGMGAVYRARDGKLGREVALKVLPEDFTADAERLARFEREAQVLAALNHPNVAAIYEIGQTTRDDGAELHFLVMELAEGEDLSLHLARGPVGLETALPIALQIAQGLEVAHTSGIVHRDLKPANIMIGSNRSVKVLDFGLAKAFAQDPSSGPGSLSMSPTLTAQMTQAGTLLGTAAYMSPEQARGENADQRADVWAFGTVLMEMLTGQKVFPGKTVSDSLAGILAREPEWDALPSDLPAPIRHLLERCLEKETSDRLQAIGEARIAIERYLANPEAAVEEASSAAGAPEVHTNKPVLAAATLLAALAGAAAMWLLAPDPPPPLLRKLHIPVEEQLRQPTLSPNGEFLAFVEGTTLYIRRLDSADAQAVPHDQGGIRNLFWSPDSEWLGFASSGKIWKTPAGGGTPQTIGNLDGGGGQAAGFAWSEDGTIYITTGGGGIDQISARGGVVTEVLAIDDEREVDFHRASALPDGKGMLFVVHRKGEGERDSNRDDPFDTLGVWNGEVRKDILHVEGASLSNANYSSSGHIVFRQAGDNEGIWAVPFSLDRLETTGEPFLVVPGGSSPTVAAASGVMAYVRGATLGLPESQLVWVDREGAEIERIDEPHTLRPILALSPDNSRLAVEASEDDQFDIWVHDLELGGRSRLTFEGGFNPVWSPDSQHIVFNRAGGLYIKRADGSDEARLLISSGFFPEFTPDGRSLLFTNNINGFHTYRLDLEGPEGEPELILEDAFRARVSPDGNFMAFVTTVANQTQVSLTRYPEMTGLWQISKDGGGYPEWRADGREVFYLEGQDTFMATPVGLTPSVRVGTARRLFDRTPTGIAMPFNLADRYAVSSDGQRFVIAKLVSGEAQVAPPITVVLNWFEEFRED